MLIEDANLSTLAFPIAIGLYDFNPDGHRANDIPIPQEPIILSSNV